MKTYPTSASLLLSEDCNLRCKYCFECHNDKHMTKEIAKQSIDFLIENAIKQNTGVVHLMFFGGEPLINPKVLEYSLNYGYEECLRNKLVLTASMVTNATIMNKKIEILMTEWINKIDFSVQLSVDGKKETQDMFRVTKHGKGSFDLLEKNIDTWKHIFRHKPGYLCIHGCCNEDTVDKLYENYLYFRNDWGFKSIWFIPIASDGWNDKLSNVYKEQLNLIADDVIKRYKESLNPDELVVYAPLDKCISQSKGHKVPCGAGKSFITITADGEVFPCHHFYFNDPGRETYFGDVFNGIDYDKKRIFDDYTPEDLSCSKENCDCYDCYKCIAESWCSNGSILSFTNKYKCEFAKIEKDALSRIREEANLISTTNIDINNSNVKSIMNQCSKVVRDHNNCELVILEHKKNDSCNGDCKGCDSSKDNSTTNKEMDLIMRSLSAIMLKLDEQSDFNNVIINKLLEIYL